MRNINRKITKCLNTKNSAVSSVISVLFVLMIFFGITGTMLITGPRLMDNMKTQTQNQAVGGYLSTMDDTLSNLMTKGSDKSATGEIAIDQGSIAIDSKGDKSVITYSYNYEREFYVTGFDDNDDEFTIVSNKQIDAASIYWLDDTCFLAGTNVAMADGSYKNIEAILIGDIVLSYNEELSKLTESIVEELFIHEPYEMPDYYLVINDELKVTPNHLFYSDGEWVFAGDLSVGDMLFDSDLEDLEEYEIYSLEKVYKQVESFDLDVEEIDNFFVNVDDVDVLVHNTEKIYVVDGLDGLCYEDTWVKVGGGGGYTNPFGHSTETLNNEIGTDDYDGIKVDDDDYAETKAYKEDIYNPYSGKAQQNFHITIDEDPHIIDKMDIYWRGNVYIGSAVCGFAGFFDIYNHNTSSDERVGTMDWVHTWEGSFSKTVTKDEDIMQYFDGQDIHMRVFAGKEWGFRSHFSLPLKSEYLEVKLYFNDAPSCNVVPTGTPNGNGTYTAYNPVRFEMTGTDDQSISSWELDVDNNGVVDYSGFGSGTPYWSDYGYHKFTEDGWYTAKLTVTDNFGLTATDFVTYEVVTLIFYDPTCDLAANPTSGNSELTVEFTLNAQDNNPPLGTLNRWRLDFGDGTKPIEGKHDELIDHIEKYTYVVSAPTVFTANLTVLNEYFLTNYSTIEITVQPGINNPPEDPIINSVIPPGGTYYNDTIYSFNMTADDFEGDNIRFHVDWGDGSSITVSDFVGSGEFVLIDHSWTYAGVYEIRVLVEDANGDDNGWSDPYGINIDYTFITPPDANLLTKKHIKNSNNEYPEWIIGDDAHEDIPDLTGSIIIYVFSNTYPSLDDPASGKVSLGSILISDLGYIEYNIKNTGGEYKTILESGSIISDSPTGSIMQSCSNIYEDSDDGETLGLTVKKIRGIDSTAGSGSGIYELKFKTINTIMREEQVHMLYNIKLEFSGDYAEAWNEYLVDNYKFQAQGNMLVYNYGKGTHMILSTSVIQTSLEGIN